MCPCFHLKTKCPYLAKVGHWSQVDIFDKNENPTAGLNAWGMLALYTQR